MRGIVIATVMAAVVIVIAWYLCLSTDVYDAYREWYAAGEAEFAVTRFESIRIAWMFLGESDIALSYPGNLAIGLVFCVLGCFSPIRNALARVKNAQIVREQSTADFTVEPEQNGPKE